MDKRYLNILPENSIDLIFCVTVAQHIPTEILTEYLKSCTSCLKDDGIILIQTLENRNKTVRRSSKTDVLNISYGPGEFERIAIASGLKVVSQFSEFSQNENFWGVYLLTV